MTWNMRSAVKTRFLVAAVALGAIALGCRDLFFPHDEIPPGQGNGPTINFLQPASGATIPITYPVDISAEDADGVAVDDEDGALDAHVGRERPVGGVMDEQMGERGGIGDVVDRVGR